MIGSVIFYLRFLLDAVPQIPADCRMSPQLNPLPIGPVLSVVYNVDGLEKKIEAKCYLFVALFSNGMAYKISIGQISF